MSAQELEAAAVQMPDEELRQFSQWFEEFIADKWDRQFEQDMLAGRPGGALTRH